MAKSASLPSTLKLKQQPKRDTPLWKGPSDSGPMGGITQSMLGRFLVCRERFRLTYIEGWRPTPRFDAKIEVGNMWHVCEEALAGQFSKETSQATQLYKPWHQSLLAYAQNAAKLYPQDQEQVDHWYCWVKAVFPEYVKYWSTHKDVVARTPLLQEYTFHVPYTLPSGRVVYLRGKYDSVDLIGKGKNSGIYLQENKTKGDLNQQRITTQLRFDLQTMMYLVSLERIKELIAEGEDCTGLFNDDPAVYRTLQDYKITGVRYNCIWRNCPIRRHKEKQNKAKGTITPAEGKDEFYERLLNDYVRANPQEWFMRWQVEVSKQDIDTFRTKCFDPILEQLCWWYDETTDSQRRSKEEFEKYGYPPSNWIHPYGVFNVLNEGGNTDLDEHLFIGSTVGLRQVDKLFEELT